MCGRYSLANPGQLQQRFDLTEQVSFSANTNASPTQELPVVVEMDGQRQLLLMRWGMTPRWSAGSGTPRPLINARAETVASRPSYRVPLLRQRCLVPADGFYEWCKEGTQSIPYRFQLTHEPLFAFAGIYDRWRDADGRPGHAFSIITTRANELVAPIHDRMPVILHRGDEERWLDADLRDPAALTPLLEPYPAGAMATQVVSLGGKQLAAAPELPFL